MNTNGVTAKVTPFRYGNTAKLRQHRINTKIRIIQ